MFPPGGARLPPTLVQLPLLQLGSWGFTPSGHESEGRISRTPSGHESLGRISRNSPAILVKRV